VTKLVALLDNRPFVIEHDDNVGYYLYVFDGDKCLYDYLLDTLEVAIERALKQFDVPKASWRPAV
jgi:hypothetical protein